MSCSQTKRDKEKREEEKTIQALLDLVTKSASFPSSSQKLEVLRVLFAFEL